MPKPIMVEIQDADADGHTMWLVSWGGPNPEEQDCAEVVSAEDALKIIDRWPKDIPSAGFVKPMKEALEVIVATAQTTLGKLEGDQSTVEPGTV